MEAKQWVERDELGHWKMGQRGAEELRPMTDFSMKYISSIAEGIDLAKLYDYDLILLDLDLPERRIILDDEGKVDHIHVPDRLDAHKLIEECMLCANVAAAEFFEANELPILFKDHHRVITPTEYIDAILPIHSNINDLA